MSTYFMIGIICSLSTININVVVIKVFTDMYYGAFISGIIVKFNNFHQGVLNIRV